MNELISKEEIDADFALSADLARVKTNPAVMYVASLGSKVSQLTVAGILNRVARMSGYNDIYDAEWPKLDRGTVFALLEILIKKGLGANTRNLYLSCIKGVAREAYIARQIGSDAYERIKLIKSSKSYVLPKGRALGIDEIKTLMQVCTCGNTKIGIRDAAILAVLFGCGPRKAELVSIEVKDIDLVGANIKIVGKGNKERFLEMPSRTAELVAEWLNIRGHGDGKLFVKISRWGTLGDAGLTRIAINQIVEKRITQSGLASATPHDFRRSFITYLLDVDEGIDRISDMVGHSSINTTMRYVRGRAGRNKKAAAKISF